MGAKLLEDSSTPLYQQVANDLKTTIENGIYRVGQKIPPEPELSQLYSVSRITVRKAIELLVEDGLLSKRQGKGTFVCQSEPSRKIRDDRSSKVMGFSESCRANGVVPGAVLLSRAVEPVPEEERPFFGPDVEQVISIDRVRTADGQPLMVESNLFAALGLEFLESAPLDDSSLFDIIAEKTGRHAVRGSAQSLNIMLADEHLAKLLNVPIGEPLFYLLGHYHDQFGKPLYVGKQFIIGSRYTFTM